MSLLRTLILLSLFPLLHAGAQELHFININADMGLPSNECYRVAQDKQGYIWISTDAGLVRYNSKEFVLFNTSKGMPSTNDIYALDVDGKGRLWFATGKWKIGYILDGKVTVLPDMDFAVGRLKAADIIYKIKYDDAAECLYISTHYQTLVVTKVNGQYQSRPLAEPGRINNLLLINGSYTANCYKRFLLDEVYSLKEPTYLVDKSKPAILLPNQQFGHTVFFSDTSKQGLVLIGNFDKIVSFDRERQLFTHTDLANEILCLYTSSSNSTWVGCKRGGAFIFKDGDITKKPMSVLSHLSVSNIMEDREGGIWATTLERGVYYCPNPNVAKLDPLLDPGNSVTFSKVAGNSLFLSNPNTPLAIIGDMPTVYTSLGDEKNPIISDVIKVNDLFYIGSTLGFYSLHAKTNKVSRLIIPSHGMQKKNQNKAPNGNKGMFADSLGNCYDYTTMYFHKFTNGLIAGGHSVGIPIKHAVLLNNQEALVTDGDGLYICTFKGWTIKKIATNAARSLHDINRVFLDSSGNCWVLSNSDSLLVLDRQFNLKKIIPLPIANITSCRNIAQVNSKTFCIATNMGLLQLSFKTEALESYELIAFNQTNGMQSNDIYNVSLFRNKFYISTSKGICFMDSLQVLKHKGTPKTIINTFWVNDSSFIPSNENLFSYKQKNFSFQVDALAFKKIGQRGAFFKYKLLGWNDDFRAATSNIITFNNLPPGQYTFIAKAFYDGSTEDATPATFSFTIKPAFWQTWWGILLMGLTVTAIVFLFVQWRIKKIRLIEKEKAAISKTIAEYKFTALKAQMDPHFIFNSVNVIQNLILEKDKTEAYNSLEKFSRLIRMVLNQSDSAFATIEEEMSLINLYVQLNQLRVNYPFTFTVDIQPDALQCSVPSLIIQPFIENALWHGILPLKGIREGNILLKVFLEDERMLIVEVRDNGVGRKAAAMAKPTKYHVSKGLDLIKERLKAYQAMNNGSLAELHFFDLEENGIATGTLVQIRIAMVEDE